MKPPSLLPRLTCALLLGALPGLVPARGETGSPVGLWRQIDDETGEAKSVVKIYEEDGVLKGRIVKLLKEPEEGEPPVCDRCEGELKGEPYLGFPLISGMKQEGDEWAGGHIIDPESGKRYQAEMSLMEGGDKLKVRGFIGFSLFGRTQVWERVK
jgi:uncharacterized protein (DUF2147 family)